MTISQDTNDIEAVFILGTRPEIIKTAPVVRAARSIDGIQPYLVHTNQHYDPELSEAFFNALGLPSPDANLNVKSGSQAEQTAAGLAAIERIVQEREPAIVLAQGDTNAVLSAALATSKLRPAFGHIEAGLRSFDRSMPEEVNRVLADHVTDFAFVPTQKAVTNLADEGISEGVYVTGNTVVDSCQEHQPVAEDKSNVLHDLNVRSEEYTVATIHRPRNTDTSERLRRILTSLDRQDFPVVLPAHPRLKKEVRALGFEPSGSLQLVEPLDYLDFLKLLANAWVAVTDSGGVQEEASILEIPCLTVRPNTERPETTDAGVNELLEPEDIETRLATAFADSAVHASMTGHPDLYGDGTAGVRIIEILLNEL